MSAVGGVLVIDKPTGMTSHDVVNRVRKCLGIRRVGHAGTLDPDASGVLVVCVGEATRLLEYLTADDKTYVGTVTFGISTDTDDGSGNIIRRMDASGLREDQIKVVAGSLIGTYRQRVPAFSAVHIDGKRAYEWARSGKDLPKQLPEREVTIVNLDVLRFCAGETPSADFRVTCSKGTYIRSLCRDWGERLHLCAHMSGLRRTQSGRFSLDSAVTIEEMLKSSEPSKFLMRMEQAISHVASIRMDKESLVRLAHGQTIPAPADMEAGAGVYAVFDQGGRLWMMAELIFKSDRRYLHPHKVFVRSDE